MKNSIKIMLETIIACTFICIAYNLVGAYSGFILLLQIVVPAFYIACYRMFFSIAIGMRGNTPLWNSIRSIDINCYVKERVIVFVGSLTAYITLLLR